jgi:serine/threonine protein phosphatase PrpC
MNCVLLESAGITDRGSVRVDNQDQFFVAELTRCMQMFSSSLALDEGSQLTGAALGHLFMVADGMGGHRAGTEASRLAVQYFIASILNRVRWLTPNTDADEATLIDDLKQLLNQSHQEIKTQSARDTELAGMGTTFTMAYVIWPRMYIVHAGDTRCYVFRKDQLKLLTCDHTVAEQMMKSGQLSADATQRSPWSNVLFNALGAGAEKVYAEVATVPLEQGDWILLCSDGLNKHVDDASIRNVLLQHADSPQAACSALVDQAKTQGGTDNITIVAAKWSKAMGGGRMPIYQSMKNQTTLLREIAWPTEDDETTEHVTMPLSTSNLRDLATESMEEDS